MKHDVKRITIRIDLKEVGINMRNCVDSAQDRDYWGALCKCGIEPLGFISQLVDCSDDEENQNTETHKKVAVVVVAPIHPRFYCETVAQCPQSAFRLK